MNNFKKHIFKIIHDGITIIGCEQTANSGGPGVTEYFLILDKSLGGIVVFDFGPIGVPDKLEIIHNGIKKATSGMTTANAGPFDDLYGNPTVPNISQAQTTDQFIGTDKGTVPTRYSTFTSETGITNITMVNQQLVWWVYSEADYLASNTVNVRVTGVVGTGWNFQRHCTSQTPTGVTPQPDPTPTQPSGGSVIGFGSSDSIHPEAYVTYIDGFGAQQTILVYTENNDCVTFYAREVIDSRWCTQCL